jgi:hypothetical protein
MEVLVETSKSASEWAQAIQADRFGFGQEPVWSELVEAWWLTQASERRRAAKSRCVLDGPTSWAVRCA